MLKKHILFSLFLFSFQLNAQVSGLSEWSIFIDPGHSQTENMGIYNYSEAQKVLRIALYLDELLETKTDIGDVYLSRTNDQQQVSLSQRTSLANSLNTDWYHSIHSDAGSTVSNSTLLLHGGWRSNSQTIEKTPHGGKVMSDIMVDILTRTMRTTTRGNYADRTFYQGFPANHDNQFPYLHVNRESNMASELSEGGFHTNPMQNQLNMNADWKKIEAYAIFWTILKYHNLSRPDVNVVTGIVRNIETGSPINGASITIADSSYVTDTYESLFHNYTTDPEQLSNGFYYLDGIQGDSVDIIVTAEGYIQQNRTVAIIDTFFTFQDFNLVSDTPPYITGTYPAQGDSNVLNFSGIGFTFSRPMNRDSVENAFSIEPPITGTFRWLENDTKIFFETEEMTTNTDYQVTISASARDRYGNLFDGNGDGVTGDNYVLIFRTGLDEVAPVLTSAHPRFNQTNIELHPIISYAYNEYIDSSSISLSPITVTNNSTSVMIDGITEYYTVNGKTVFNYFPSEKLNPLTRYIVNIQSGFADIFGNTTQSALIYPFNTGQSDFNIISIDNFDGLFTNFWWQPNQSGSTTGINLNTERFANTSILNRLSASTQSMRIDYDWDLGSNSWLIREYLSGGPARDISFDTSYKLQVYVFGDGSNTKFRFALDEGTSSTNFPNHEVSTWFVIDWIGWRLVEWDLSDPGMVGSWLGNGVLDLARYRIDSFQLSYENSAESGSIYFDDLRIVSPFVVGIEQPDINVPQNYSLGQNYPNPFNPTTKIDYSIPGSGQVTIDVFNYLGQRISILFDGYQSVGKYSLVFNGTGYAAGTYVLRMRINNKSFVRKMTLLK